MAINVTKPTANKPDFNPLLANRAEPSTPKKNTGYIVNEPLPSGHFNWLMYSISLWITYFDTCLDALLAYPGMFQGGPEQVVANKYIGPEDDGKIFFVDPSAGNTLTEDDEEMWGIFSGDPDFFPPGSDIAFASTSMYGLWFVLPDPGEVEAGFKFTIKDHKGLLSETTPITLIGGKIAFMTWQGVRVEGNGGFYESEFGPATRFITPRGSWTLIFDGDEWYFI